MDTEKVMDEKSTPAQDGFYMPGEFEPHEGCILIWPSRPGSWPHEARAARKAFREVIRAIAKSEHVYVAAGKEALVSAHEMLDGIENVTIFMAETDDAWARDVAPTFVVRRVTESRTETRMTGSRHPDTVQNPQDRQNGSRYEEQKKTADRSIRCVNWEFNAWGGTYNGLYASWEKDNAFAKTFAAMYGTAVYDAAPFVLEGGSIHSDGEGTVLVTEACLLSPGRNPHLGRKKISEMLCAYLGAEKVIWLPRGIYMDETDEHVDNVCAFVRTGEVALAWTDNEADPQYALSRACLDILEKETDARGRKLVVHKLPIPDHPICIREEDLEGYQFEEGEDVREIGERLAASYVNFYFSNGAVVVPAFGGENEASDRRAQEILKKICPEREVIAVYAKDILLGGGNIHCITQQIPLNKEEYKRRKTP